MKYQKNQLCMNKPLKVYSGPRKQVEVFDSQKLTNQVIN